ncbi:MAG: sugar system component, partial [Pseudonocardiales bacterium]|nr:sugar system component [Pseudonocardiales bacterium]
MTEVDAPLAGTLTAITDVPDPVFAGQLVGSGAAVEPPADAGPLDVVSPIDGQLVKVHPHAFIVVAPGGTGILVHLGIDTVKLEG